MYFLEKTGIMQFFTSILYYLFFIITGIPLILISLLIWLVTILFDRRLRALHIFTQFWSIFLYSVVPGWKVRVEGKEKIDNNRVVVYIANHQSEFDIVVMSFLLACFKWVSKQEVFKAPIVGWNMKLNRYISLRRGSKSGVVRMLRDCETNLKNGNSVFLFPEGTRSLTGDLGRFSSGAFALAQRLKCDIQPIVLNGTKDIMKKHDWKLHFKADVRLKVLDRISYESFSDKTTKELEQEVRALMEQELEKIR